ncbi:MAG: UDP-N-acetylmuramoyl-L-alanyl-D-glutamate--2,6-diaminopimelate ligase [Candidatus Omnitrophica bacterium]|nr:UDP-N-acetylmuramoyl-L-alanyl-D-glutamate--2,6-diaminopimelate ligase [Candidatus Omnitrophota bacterium]
MDLKKILSGVKIRTGENIGGVDISKVTDDSRKVEAGDLFVAVRGYSLDASKFVDLALKAGARAIVTEKDFNSRPGVAKILVDDTRSAMSTIADNFYGHPSCKLKVIGITGTNGKTTITYLIESVVKAAGKADAGIIGTINYRFNGKVFTAINTTPGPMLLQEMLAEMAASKIGCAIMEVSSHSLDQGRVDNILFDVGIFTNLTSDHLDYHKTTTNYFKAKRRLFDKLKTKGRAVLNMDDKKVASLKGSIKSGIITYGIKSKADVTAENIALSMDGTRFTVNAPGMSFEMRTKLIGIHNVSNVLAAVAAALALKIPKKAIIEGIESVDKVPGRLEAVETGQPFKIFVDFAHTEDALFNVLNLLREVAKRRIVTVFGCGGNRDRTKRPLMGKVACKYSDHVIVTSDNPRFEKPEDIIGEIEAGIKGKFSNYDIIADRKEAISKALGSALKDDIIIIAGKGHEGYQIIKDKIMPFDDRKVALSILKKL